MTIQPGRVWLTFSGAADKGRKESRVPVTATTAELILEALDKPKVQAHGWLLPGGQEHGIRGSHAPWGGFDITGSAGSDSEAAQSRGPAKYSVSKGQGISWRETRPCLGVV